MSGPPKRCGKDHYRQPVEPFVSDLIDRRAAISIISLAEIRVGWTDEQAARYLPMLRTVLVVETLTIAHRPGSAGRVRAEEIGDQHRRICK
jgi:hypothetical protein